MIQTVLNDEHLGSVLAEALGNCRHRLFIATADLKDLHLPFTLAAKGEGVAARQKSRSILELFAQLSRRGVQVSLLHSSAPSGPFIERLKKGKPATLTMRCCPRVHAKAVIADGRRMYLGSANMTGAGLGAKSARRRNFEAGIWTDDVSLIDPVMDMLEEIWSGNCCRDCGRKDHCPVPLEEPHL